MITKYLEKIEFSKIKNILSTYCKTTKNENRTRTKKEKPEKRGNSLLDRFFRQVKS